MQKNVTIQDREYTAEIWLHRPESLRILAYTSVNHGLEYLQNNLAGIAEQYSKINAFSINFKPLEPQTVTYITYIMGCKRSEPHNGLVFTANKITALYYTLEGNIYNGNCRIKTYSPYQLINSKGHAQGYDARLSDSMRAKLDAEIAPLEQWIFDNMQELQKSELDKHIQVFAQELTEQIELNTKLANCLTAYLDNKAVQI